MSQSDFLQRLVDAFLQAGVSYMIAGSLASTHHGKPRTTYDIDIIIDADESSLSSFLDLLSEGYYVSRPAAEKALADRSMFNVIDFDTGIKADLIIRKDRPFSLEEFQRRQLVEVAGVKAYVATPEDSILSKLEWRQISDSERQYDDAVGVAEVSRDQLDLNYLTRWAKELGVDDLLTKLCAEIGFNEF